jgi:membrane dipeptidase
MFYTKTTLHMKKIALYVFFIFCCVGLLAQPNKKLHQQAIVVDTHNDVLTTVTLKGQSVETDLRGKAHSDIARWKEGGVDVQIFSIFCDERQVDPFQFALREIDSLDAIVKRNPDKWMLVNMPTQLKEALQQNKLACMKGMEGGHMIENKLENLDSLFKRGVRYMTLTWNNSTPWASSAADETQSTLPTGQHKGLNDFGKQVVKRMNELGMLVDLSHVGEQTFYDAMATTTKPVIASHSCVYRLCGHRRNLKDDQIKAVAKNGGVIHLNFYSGFLDSTYEKKKELFLNGHKTERDSLQQLKWASYEMDEFISKKYSVEAEALRPPLSLLIDHIDYIVKMVGIDHVGLGSDFDGIESAPKELNGVEDFPKITEALLQRGYSKKDVKKILGENFLRVFRANAIN